MKMKILNQADICNSTGVVRQNCIIDCKNCNKIFRSKQTKAISHNKFYWARHKKGSLKSVLVLNGKCSASFLVDVKTKLLS